MKKREQGEATKIRDQGRGLTDELAPGLAPKGGGSGPGS